MKKNKLLTLIGTALVGLGPPAWAGPHGGGGGFAGGGHFGGSHFGGYSGGPHAAPAFSGGARFSGRSIGGLSGAPFFYYGGTRMSAVRPHGFTAATSRSISPNAGRVAAANRQPNRAGSLVRQNGRVSSQQTSVAANRQPNRVGSLAGRNRVSDPRASTASNRQSFIRNHAFARHDGNWHRDWDKHRAHFHNNLVFIFVDGFWWGLYPQDYYPYYAYSSDPSDYYGYPYGYEDYPYDSSDSYTQDPYSYYNGYAPPAQSGNGVVSSVQSQLAKLGYYRGAVDGVAGDETQAALARYQEDNDLSVTGTVTAATLQSLGLAGR